MQLMVVLLSAYTKRGKKLKSKVHPNVALHSCAVRCVYVEHSK